MLISEEYREQNRQLHAEHKFYGGNSKTWVPYMERMIKEEGFLSVLDYGCGKGFLKRDLTQRDPVLAARLLEYDPAIEGKEAMPEPAELVICTDVLEHIEPENLNAVLKHLKKVTTKKLFVSISTRPSKKTLADGRNAHLLVKDATWWRERLSKFFYITLWEVRPEFVYGEMTPLTAALRKSEKMRRKAGKEVAKKRRALTPEWMAEFERIKEANNRYADAFSRIETIRMFEMVDDQPADMQVACNILEYLSLPEVDDAVAKMATLSRKAGMITAKLDEQRNEAYWKRVFEKRFRLADSKVENGHIVLIGAPMVGVQGVTATGAVGKDERWAQIEAASKRFPTRVKASQPHGRHAIVACYGPSLADTLDELRARKEETGGDIISVSGAHDFLIENGIIPDYHLECDPRPHKADNIKVGHPDVEYLLASVCNPVLFDKLDGHKVTLWHVSTPEHAVKIVDDLGESNEALISGGGSVGLRSIPLFYTLGYRDFSIFAMDCSFKQDGEEVHQWAGRHFGKRQDQVLVECAGQVFVSSPVLMTYATGFFEAIQKVDDANFRLYGKGLLQSMCDYYMAQSAPIMERVEQAA